MVAHIFFHHEIRHQHTAVLNRPQGLPAVIAQDQHRPAVGGKKVLDSEENPTTAGPGPVQTITCWKWQRSLVYGMYDSYLMLFIYIYIYYIKLYSYK